MKHMLMCQFVFHLIGGQYVLLVWSLVEVLLSAAVDIIITNNMFYATPFLMSKKQFTV